ARPGQDGVENPLELGGLPQARRSAAEEDTLDPPLDRAFPEPRRSGVELADHGVRVSDVVARRSHVAHEVAVRALREAPRKVDVGARAPGKGAGGARHAMAAAAAGRESGSDRGSD